MTAPGREGLRRASRWLRSRFVRGALILLYHRVAELPSDPQLLCVTPQHFAEHLYILRKRGFPVRLPQLTQQLQDGNLPPRAVVVSFDDGYADNLHNAKRLLEWCDIPATFFVTTGYLGQEREFWWDELERVLLNPGTLPERLQLGVNGNVCQWELGEATQYSVDAYRRYCHWNVLEKDDPGPRQQLYRSVCQLLRPLPDGERRKVLDELLAWAGTEPKGRPTHRALSLEEAFELAEGELVEVGSHSMTHSVLSALPAASQRVEIERSKTCLEEILGRPVTSFAYPYGTRSDYTEETVGILREGGFARACSNFADVVWRGTDPYQLPRVLVRDCDGEAFARRLEELFRGVV